MLLRSSPPPIAERLQDALERCEQLEARLANSELRCADSEQKLRAAARELSACKARLMAREAALMAVEARAALAQDRAATAGEEAEAAAACAAQAAAAAQEAVEAAAAMEHEKIRLQETSVVQASTIQALCGGRGRRVGRRVSSRKSKPSHSMTSSGHTNASKKTQTVSTPHPSPARTLTQRVYAVSPSPSPSPSGTRTVNAPASPSPPRSPLRADAPDSALPSQSRWAAPASPQIRTLSSTHTPIRPQPSSLRRRSDVDSVRSHSGSRSPSRVFAFSHTQTHALNGVPALLYRERRSLRVCVSLSTCVPVGFVMHWLAEATVMLCRTFSSTTPSCTVARRHSCLDKCAGKACCALPLILPSRLTCALCRTSRYVTSCVSVCWRACSMRLC